MQFDGRRDLTLTTHSTIIYIMLFDTRSHVTLNLVLMLCISTIQYIMVFDDTIPIELTLVFKFYVSAILNHMLF